ncbi:aminoglycoside phosphotransferase family protein [Marinactinospora thermotolerans]|uniref:Streptomycin 6-kinase n=1 Tax=Marinactinospora thermotolerans DSM 45154 TaxID=1122192 RepID=A0A1T4QDK4_9ACTN|nr:aminoglycoside phosphotransferase family protein [Marinactinospora thermotolerans]SKA01812.1 streptomycin 6-kinase [Marinactinospora thermotolerans DSM 45154]
MSDVTAQLVDDEQRDRLVRRFGAGARNWLAAMPALVDEIAREWGLTIDGPAPHGATSVVLYCRREDGTPAVLKVGPEPRLIRNEAQILRLWEGTRRVPEVWQVDGRRGGLLMEAISPGRSIAEAERAPTVEEIAALIADLHGADIPERDRGRLHPLHSRIHFVFDLWERYRADGLAAEFVPASVLHHGHARARALASGEDDLVPLHGDLHPGNVLDGGPERGLVAVDPRGCLGDAAADAADWALWRVESVEEIEHRAAILATGVGVPTERLLAWARALAPIMAIAVANRGGASSASFATLMDFGSC